MMTAVMMKADTRPAKRGSKVGASWTIVMSSPTLSWEGVSTWSLAVELLGGLMVVVRWALLEEFVVLCGDESVVDSGLGGC